VKLSYEKCGRICDLSNSSKKSNDIDSILLDLKEGRIDLETARRELNLFSIEHISGLAALDPGRHGRTGIPEVVYADTKTPEDVAVIALKLFERNGYAFVTRADKDYVGALESFIQERKLMDVKVDYNARGRTILLSSEGFESLEQKHVQGRIGIITAGTSDISVAEEAKETCKFMGCEVRTAYDVGISGIHRLFPPLKDMIGFGVDVIIVVAGMEGALPSVVSSLVDIPVIGVPCSVGYGYGGKGESALMSMLQSCSPGLLVVNIDNGFGAGVGAALIARRTEVRKEQEDRKRR